VAGETPAFGDALKRYRRAAGLTQEMLAERAGYSTVYVSMLERGQRAPLPSTLQALADALDLSPRDRAGLQAAARIGDRSSSGFVLAGRERELQLLSRHLLGDGPPVLLLAGEPGIGKSRLLREAAARAALEGMTVLSGGCVRRGGQEPYAPLLDVLQRHIGGAAPEQLRADLEGCVWLSRLLPELAELHVEGTPRGAAVQREAPMPPLTLSSEGEHRLMSQAFMRFLRNISGPAGALLLLDDLQWAGSDALDLLALLARSSAETSVRLIGAYRDTEVHARHPLSAMLGELAQAGLARHLALSPLSDDATARLLDELLSDVRLPAVVRERALRRAGGVPFFVVSCAQSLRLGAGSGDELPWDLAQSVRQRLAALTERAEETLGVAALIGRRIPVGVLVAASSRDEDEILDDVDQACRLRLLEEQGDDAYLFTHDVVREVVEHDLSAARRSLLHRRIGAALEASAPRAVETLAYHFTRSGDSARAVLYLERAGDTARAQHAAAAAEGYYRELVDRLDGRDERDRAARAREKLSDALAILARYDEALGVLERAAREYRGLGDSEGEARSAAQIGRIHSRRGSAEEGILRLEPLRDHLTLSGPSRALAELNVALAPLFLARERYRDQLAAAENAAGWARSAGDEGLLAEAEVWRGCALNQLGRWDEGRAVQEAAIPLCEAVNDLTSLSHALNDIAFAHESAGRFDRSKFYKGRALEVAERLGDPAGIANMTFRCGQLAFLQGAWDDARALYLRALDLARQVGSSSIAPYPHFGLARLSLAQGELDEARGHAETCLTSAEESQDHQAMQAALGVLAECDLARGDAASARRRLGDLEAGEEGLALYGIAPIIAEVLLRSGEEAAARQWAERSVERARERCHQVDLIDALRVRALIRAAAGEQDAAGDIHEALSLARHIGYAFGEARTLDASADLVAARQSDS
jgi:transcriptional regulator with XRE-family HTH domain/tetratricopeptide (TPR) repeat protein